MAVYSALKPLRYPDRLAAIGEGHVPAPVHVRIKPMNRCNHNCWYCAYRADNLALGGEMDEAARLPEPKMAEIVEDLIDMRVQAVTFSGGGEPLLYKSLPDHIERLASAGIAIGALTNGSTLKARMAEAFANHGTWLRVSIDGWDDASYAASRGLPIGAFTRLLGNMRDFVARGSRCALGVSFIVGTANHAHLLDVCRMLKDIGVAHVKLSGVVVGNDGAANNAYHAPIRTVVAQQIEQALALACDGFDVLDHYHELGGLFAKPYRSCPIARMLTIIGADSAVYLCQDKAYTAEGRLGSIRDRRFKDFWFSDENREALARLDPSRHCAHHCAAHSKNLLLTEYLSVDPVHARFV